MLESKQKEKTELKVKKKQEKKQKLVGSIKPQRGHTLFKVSKDTLEISKGKFEDNDTIKFSEAKAGKKLSKKVIVEDGFFYITALNEANCKKKIIKMLNITKEDLDELESKVKASK